MPSISSIQQSKVVSKIFTLQEKESLRHLEYHLKFPKTICQFILIAYSLRNIDKSLYAIAVEMNKMKKNFNHQTFYRITSKLRDLNHIKIFKDKDFERFIEITNPLIHTIMQM